MESDQRCNDVRPGHIIAEGFGIPNVAGSYGPQKLFLHSASNLDRGQHSEHASDLQYCYYSGMSDDTSATMAGTIGR